MSASLLLELWRHVSDPVTLERLRRLNALLALAANAGLFYRVPQALRGVRSRRLFIALALFPPVVGIGSVQAIVLNPPAGPVIPLFTGLWVSLIAVCIAWDPMLEAPRPQDPPAGDVGGVRCRPENHSTTEGQ